MSIYIGIDPGVGGGIAALENGGRVLLAIKAPATHKDLLTTIAYLIRDSPEGRPVAVLEKVASSPQMGVVSAFTFGKGYGALQMALAALEIPFDEVVPRKWQAAVGVTYPAKARDTEKKNISKRRAQALFPHETITHATADALLIAEYCRRSHRR